MNISRKIAWKSLNLTVIQFQPLRAAGSSFTCFSFNRKMWRQRKSTDQRLQTLTKFILMILFLKNKINLFPSFSRRLAVHWQQFTDRKTAPDNQENNVQQPTWRLRQPKQRKTCENSFCAFECKRTVKSHFNNGSTSKWNFFGGQKSCTAMTDANILSGKKKNKDGAVSFWLRFKHCPFPTFSKELTRGVSSDLPFRKMNMQMTNRNSAFILSRRSSHVTVGKATNKSANCCR